MTEAAPEGEGPTAIPQRGGAQGGGVACPCCKLGKPGSCRKFSPGKYLAPPGGESWWPRVSLSSAKSPARSGDAGRAGWVGPVWEEQRPAGQTHTFLHQPGTWQRALKCDRPRQRPAGPTYYTLSTRTPAWPEALAHR